MKSTLDAIGLFILAAAMIAAILCIAPMLVLWAINTLAEAVGLGWQIPHDGWTYLATWVLLAFAKVPGR